jgi:hypothetical protein
VPGGAYKFCGECKEGIEGGLGVQNVGASGGIVIGGFIVAKGKKDSILGAAFISQLSYNLMVVESLRFI